MLLSVLNKIRDYRRNQGKRYGQAHILLFAVMAILSSADSYRKISDFIARHYITLNEYFGLNWKRIPAYTTVRNIILNTSSEELEEAFREYAEKLTEDKTEDFFVGIDGKVLRGSFDNFKDRKAVQILGAFADEAGIILAHEEIEEKSNEIPAARKLIKELGLQNCIFTLDALHCQEKTLQAAEEVGCSVIVQVKENQKTLLEDCRKISDNSVPDDTFKETVVKSRNRIESRATEIFTSPDLTDKEKWSPVESVIKVERHREVFDTKKKKWKNSDEISFYVAISVLSAEKCCRGIRRHWGSENRNHYVRDVSLNEDKSRIRVNPHIFAKLRSFALNILRRNGVVNVSSELFRNCMDIGQLFNYVGVF